MKTQIHDGETHISDDQKAIEAAEFIGAKWDTKSQECVYFDDSTRKHYLCESESEMCDLYDLIHSDDEDVSRDAYSHWCAQTNHDEVSI